MTLTLPATDDFSATLEDLRQRAGDRWHVASPDAEAFWRGHQSLLENRIPLTPEQSAFNDSLRGGEITLGFLGRSHLGDVLCTTPLLRQLSTELNCRVYSARHRSTYKVFENNPHLAGFRNDDRVTLRPSGIGHMVQRLQHRFGLRIEPFPRGEVFLSPDELAWAWSIRAMLPRNRPVAVVSVGSRTDNHYVPTKSLLWQEWIDILSRRYTVIQAAVTNVQRLEETARLDADAIRAWRPDAVMDNCLVLENLTTRQFFALFSLADLFLGTNTGSLHAAAALSVPCLVALPQRKYPALPTFPNPASSSIWTHETFLYPQHTYLWQLE